MIAAALSTVTLAVLLVGLGLALIQARRWRAGRTAAEAKGEQGRLLVGPSSDEAALAIYECLQEQGVLPR